MKTMGNLMRSKKKIRRKMWRDNTLTDKNNGFRFSSSWFPYLAIQVLRGGFNPKSQRTFFARDSFSSVWIGLLFFAFGCLRLWFFFSFCVKELGFVCSLCASCNFIVSMTLRDNAFHCVAFRSNVAAMCAAMNTFRSYFSEENKIFNELAYLLSNISGATYGG